MTRVPTVHRPSRVVVATAAVAALLALSGCAPTGAPGGDRAAGPTPPATSSPGPGSGRDHGADQSGADQGGTDHGADQEAPAASGATGDFTASIRAYVECMAEHGITGYDEERVAAGILDVSPVDVSDPAFVPADEECAPLIDAQQAH